MQLLCSTLVGYLLTVGLVWLFDPAIHFFDKRTADPTYVIFESKDINQQYHRDNITFSVVIPSYNEEARIGIMLNETMGYFGTWDKTLYEIIIVDDGSTDKTLEVAREFQRKVSDTVCKVIKIDENIGKGGAIKLGVKHATGNYVLMADADGATDIYDLDQLYKSILGIESYQEGVEGSLAVAIGSRAHLEKSSVVNRSLIRTVLMRGFHTIVSLLCSKNIRDTQCGFKLFTRKAAKILFGNLHVSRWAFDVELIFISEMLHIPIQEIAVTWHEVEGSKLIRNKIDIVTTSLTMARDILCIRLCYLLGIWKMSITDSDDSYDMMRERGRTEEL